MRRQLAITLSAALVAILSIPTIAFAVVGADSDEVGQQELVVPISQDTNEPESQDASGIAEEAAIGQAAPAEKGAFGQAAPAEQARPEDQSTATVTSRPGMPVASANRGCNYVDNDGDGVCDNYANGNCDGSGSNGNCNGSGANGNGACDGSGPNWSGDCANRGGECPVNPNCPRDGSGRNANQGGHHGNGQHGRR